MPGGGQFNFLHGMPVIWTDTPRQGMLYIFFSNLLIIPHGQGAPRLLKYVFHVGEIAVPVAATVQPIHLACIRIHA